MTTVRTNILEGMKPKETVLSQKAAKAIDLLEKAKAVLNGYFPDAEEAIESALTLLFEAGGDEDAA